MQTMEASPDELSGVLPLSSLASSRWVYHDQGHRDGGAWSRILRRRHGWTCLYPVWSECHTEDEILEVDESNQLYTSDTSATIRLPDGQPRREGPRMPPGTPRNFQIVLIFRCETRAEKLRTGPTWTDATELSQLGMKETQPNLEHWKPLYDLEVL